MARRRIDASHVIAFQDGGHRHLRDGIVVIDGSEIVHVGPQGSWDEPVDETIDASGMVVTPGFINTPILGIDAAMKDMLGKQHLHGKLIEPVKVASVVAFLFTEAASAVNGSTIPVDDGFLIFKNS